MHDGSGIEFIGPLLGGPPQIKLLGQAHWDTGGFDPGTAIQSWPVGQGPQAADPVQFISNPEQVWFGPQLVVLPTPGQNVPPKAGAGHSQAPYMTVGPKPAAGQVRGHHLPGIAAGVSPMMTRVTEL